MSLILATKNKPKKLINLNTMAVRISNMEAGKKEVNIAQIKEVLRCVLTLLGDELEDNPLGVIELLRLRSSTPSPYTKET